VSATTSSGGDPTSFFKFSCPVRCSQPIFVNGVPSPAPLSLFFAVKILFPAVASSRRPLCPPPAELRLTTELGDGFRCAAFSSFPPLEQVFPVIMLALAQGNGLVSPPTLTCGPSQTMLALPFPFDEPPAFRWFSLFVSGLSKVPFINLPDPVLLSSLPPHFLFSNPLSYNWSRQGPAQNGNNF